MDEIIYVKLHFPRLNGGHTMYLYDSLSRAYYGNIHSGTFLCCVKTHMQSLPFIEKREKPP